MGNDVSAVNEEVTDVVEVDAEPQEEQITDDVEGENSGETI